MALRPIEILLLSLPVFALLVAWFFNYLERRGKANGFVRGEKLR